MKSFSQRKTLHYNNKKYIIDHSATISWEDFKNEIKRVISNNQLQFYGVEYDDQKDVVQIIEPDEWKIAKLKFSDFSIVFDNPYQDEDPILTEKVIQFDFFNLQKEMKDTSCLKVFEEAHRKRRKEKMKEFYLLLQIESKKLYPTDEEVYQAFKKNEQNNTYLDQVIEAINKDFPYHFIKDEQIEMARKRRENECFLAMDKKGEIVGDDKFHHEAVVKNRTKKLSK